MRQSDVVLTHTPEGIAKLAASTDAASRDQILVIEIDAWNIRERDD